MGHGWRSRRADSEWLQSSQELGCGSLLQVVQVVAKAELTERPRLWVVTRGAEHVGVESAPVSVSQTPLWGSGRTIAVEHPELGCVCVDLDPAGEVGEVESLLGELLTTEPEGQVAFRGNERHVARLVRAEETKAVARANDGESLQLQIPTRGVLDNLVLQPVKRVVPGAGEVEIRVGPQV